MNSSERYHAAGRIHIIKKASDSSYVQAFQYGSTNARLMDMDYGYGYLKIFASTGGTTLAEYTEYAYTVPSWTKSYTYFGDTQLATVTPNGTGGEFTEFNHPDRLGTKVITNQARGTSYEQATLPFGTALNAESTGSTNTRFTSYDRSAPTGLDYAINRTYDPKQGRFTTVDPIGMSAVSLASPQTLNMYTYCGNDPINFTDPSGLFFGKIFRWLANVFKKFGRLIIRILGHISNAANTRSSLIITNLMAGTRAIDTISSISVAILTRIVAGLYAVGAIANLFSSSGQTKSNICPPSAKELMKNATVLKHLQDAWNDSKFNTSDAHEEGGWIYANSEGVIIVERAPAGGVSSIDLTNPPDPPSVPGLSEFQLVATFHTHPHPRSTHKPGPSPNDKFLSDAWNMPDIIRSSEGLYRTGPKRRGSNPSKAQTPNFGLMNGYPGNSEDTRKCKKRKRSK